jgi:hypothetical protein
VISRICYTVLCSLCVDLCLNHECSVASPPPLTLTLTPFTDTTLLNASLPSPKKHSEVNTVHVCIIISILAILVLLSI